MIGYADVGMSVRATKGGAIDFPQKPLNEHDVLDAEVRTETVHRHQREIASVTEGIRDRIFSLISREKEVLDRYRRGLLNKQIAAELGISESW